MNNKINYVFHYKERFFTFQKYLLMVLLMAGSLACTQAAGKTETEADEGQSPLYIKIEKPDIKSLKPLYLSEFVEKIDYVQLETLNQCLLPPNIGASLTKDFIFVWVWSEILYQFDKDGKFIRQIGRKGQGPGEYKLDKCGFDDVNKRILVVSQTSRTPLLFDYDGKYLGKVSDSLISTHAGLEHFSVGDGYFVFTFHPMDVIRQQESGFGTNELAVYDYIKNEITQTLPNRHVCEDNRNSTTTISHNPSMQSLTKHEGVFYYHSFYNDTMYTVSKNNIQPYAIIDFGKYKLDSSPYSNDLMEAHAGKMRIISTFFHHDAIYFETWIFHHRSAIADDFICKYDITSKQLTYHSNRIINDIDGNQNIDINGLKYGGTNVRNPEEYPENKDFFFSTLDKSKLKHPEQKEKLERMLKENIEKEDNPILMILHKK